MKYLIKFFVITTLITFTLSAQAQVKFGIKAGVNLANISQNYEDSDDEINTKSRLALNLGVTVDYAISEKVSFQSGLSFSGKGFALNLKEPYDGYETEGVKGYSRLALNYLEIPVNVAYKIKDFQIYAGPYLAVGISGKSKYDYSITYDYGSESYTFEDEGSYDYKPVFGEVSAADFSDDSEPFRALDYGLNLGVGYDVGPVVLSLGYSLGLGNITPKYEGSTADPSDFKFSNRVLNVSVTYFLGE